MQSVKESSDAVAAKILQAYDLYSGKQVGDFFQLVEKVQEEESEKLATILFQLLLEKEENGLGEGMLSQRAGDKFEGIHNRFRKDVKKLTSCAAKASVKYHQ